MCGADGLRTGAMHGRIQQSFGVAFVVLACFAFSNAIFSIVNSDGTRDAPDASVRCGLVLTYDNRGLNDGAGAQVQRIISLYLIAKHVGAGYVHSPIQKIRYQGLNALAENASMPRYESRWNEAFALPSFDTQGCSSDAVAHGDGCLHTFEGSLSNLQDLRQRHQHLCYVSRGSPTVLHATFAHEITDAMPHILHSASIQSLLPWVREQSQIKPLTPRELRVAIHVRRGDLSFRQPHRMLPNEYYVAVALEISRVLDKLRIPWKMDVHTEGVERSTLISPNQVGLEPWDLVEPIDLSPDSSLRKAFRSIKRTHLRINGDALQAMRDLVAADVLVISPSSFSYVAGLIRDPGTVLVIYHPFWHRPRPDWFCVGNFRGMLSLDDITRLNERIRVDFEARWRSMVATYPTVSEGI